MASSVLPDHYAALGVLKTADAAAIKTAYRKLVLKCHPDKVTDESLKKQKQEEFHKIQLAWETIGDEDKRATYDAEVKLDTLRREKLARAPTGPTVEIRTTHYDTRTAVPAGASTSFSTRGSTRYEERKPTHSRSYEEDRYFDDRTSRKYDTYEAYPKHSTPRASRPEKEHVRVTRTSSDRTRSERTKTRDREARDRSGKYMTPEDDSSAEDEKAQYEAQYKRRNEEDEARKQAAAARRKADDRRSYEEPRRRRSDDRDLFDRQRKLSEQEDYHARYISRSKGEGEKVSPSKTASREAPREREYHDSRSRRDRETVRRSSARPKDRPESSGRDRKGGPQIVDWGEEERSVPSFKHSSSSPADLHVPSRLTPQRSYTDASSRDHHHRETSPTPLFRRSETMPTVHVSRRKEASTSRPSGLRSSESVTPLEPETVFPTVPPPQSTSTRTTYYYTTPAGGVTLRPEDMGAAGVANGHRTVVHEPARHEPTRHRTRSPSPMTRPPIGPNRPVENLAVPPPLGRAATFNVSPNRPDDRGRSRLYGEIHPEYTRREAARRQTSFSPERVAYAPKYGPDDIRWAPRAHDRTAPVY